MQQSGERVESCLAVLSETETFHRETKLLKTCIKQPETVGPRNLPDSLGSSLYESI